MAHRVMSRSTISSKGMERGSSEKHVSGHSNISVSTSLVRGEGEDSEGDDDSVAHIFLNKDTVNDSPIMMGVTSSAEFTIKKTNSTIIED